MKDYLILEIAVTTPFDTQYWRVRWMEDGEESDQACFSATLAEVARDARLVRVPVVWRYYETGV